MKTTFTTLAVLALLSGAALAGPGGGGGGPNPHGYGNLPPSSSPNPHGN